MSNYNPKKMIVSAAGKVNHNEFVNKITEACSNLPQGINTYREEGNYVGGEYREEKKDLEQIHLLLG